MGALLKGSELCKRLGVSRTWLYEATKAGRIPSVRLPGAGGTKGPLRYDEDAIDKWLEAQRAGWTPGRSQVG